jgi:hypothetical protein
MFTKTHLASTAGAGLACLAVLAAVPAVAAPVEPSRPAASSTALAVAGDKLQKAAKRSPHFAGARVSEDQAGFVLYSTDPKDLTAQEAAKQHADGLPVEVRAVKRSWRELETMRDAIQDKDLDNLKIQGVSITSWGPDASTNALRFGVSDSDLDRARHVLQERYGADVTVTYEPGGSRTASRLNDVSP